MMTRRVGTETIKLTRPEAIKLQTEIEKLCATKGQWVTVSQVKKPDLVKILLEVSIVITGGPDGS